MTDVETKRYAKWLGILAALASLWVAFFRPVFAPPTSATKQAQKTP
jgi:hypothetical protein